MVMSKKKSKEVSIVPIDFSEKFEIYCSPPCGTLISAGDLAIGVRSGNEEFFVCDKQPVACVQCGAEYLIPLLFNDEESMEAERQRVIEKARETGDFRHVILTKCEDDTRATLH
jgi:hypothetical protein